MPSPELREAPARKRRQRASRGQEDGEDEGESTEMSETEMESEDDVEGRVELDSNSDSEVASDAPDDVADDAADAVVEEPSDTPEVIDSAVAHSWTRAASGTYVTYQNDYYFISNNLSRPEVVIRARPTWCKEGLLGTAQVSKSITPGQLGEERRDCPQTCLCLRAWMIHHMRSTAFHSSKPARLRAWNLEAESFQRDVRDVELLPAARKLIESWYPEGLS